MLKILRKAAVFLIPFLIVFLLFFMLEPFDYFGLKGDATYLSKPLSAMRKVRYDQPANIILGDSRMANLSTDYIEELTGEPYTMLGFGGATIGELFDLFWYAADHTQLEKVVFGLSFYNMGGEPTAGRIPYVQAQADNCLKFVSNFNNWLEVVNAAKYKSKNLLAGWLDRPDWLEYPEDPTSFVNNDVAQEPGVKYAKRLEDYAALITTQMGSDWSIRPKTYTELQKVIDYCAENGIELTFVFPPMSDVMYDLVLDKLGYADDVDALKRFCIARAQVIDLQFQSDYSANDDNFQDGFHLQGAQKKIFAELAFTAKESPYVHRYSKGGTLQ